LIKKHICFIGLLLALLCAAPSFAGVTMRVTPNGNGSFLLTGDNVVGVAALDLMIDYDSLLLVNPRVEAEGGTVTDIDAGTPGKLFVSITRGNPDAAFYLTLRFENLGRVRGARGVNSVTATSRDAGEKTPPAPDAIVTPLDPLPPTHAENGSGKYGTAVPSAGGANRSHETALNTDERTGSPSDREKSVLQRFMEFKGERGLESFAALFERGDRQRAIQYPSIALSDGKTPVTIKLELQQEENSSPDIAVWDAALVSLHKDDGKNWVVTVVPSEGAWEAKLIFKVGSEVIVCPLVVAPRVELTGNVNEGNFLAALNDYLSVQDASYEKGNILPLGEYIFTANYLADSHAFLSKKGHGIRN
jgi:hypothetical protein